MGSSNFRIPTPVRILEPDTPRGRVTLSGRRSASAPPVLVPSPSVSALEPSAELAARFAAAMAQAAPAKPAPRTFDLVRVAGSSPQANLQEATARAARAGSSTTRDAIMSPPLVGSEM